MEKKIAGLLGAMASIGAFNAAQAAPTVTPDPTAILRASSFAELLEPIANASELLRAVDESRSNQPADPNIQLAQYYHHHHHHHHHSNYRRYYDDEPRIVVVPRYRRHHHHHHHHHSFYRRDYRNDY